jgi:hypothetical protein
MAKAIDYMIFQFCYGCQYHKVGTRHCRLPIQKGTITKKMISECEMVV